MKLTFIGAGSAFTLPPDNYQSNMLLTAADGQRLLLDCGSDVRMGLHELGLGYADIDGVYISHLHADHVGGLEWLGFATRFNPNTTKPDLWVAEALQNDLWNKVLAGGMSSLSDEEATLASFFNVHPVPAGQGFAWSETAFTLVPTLHVQNGRRPMPSYGLFWAVGPHKIFLTTDAQYTPDRFAEHFAQADLIFHDCETAQRPSGVHAHYQELCQLPADIKAKMWLYHYNPGELPNATAAGFRGFVTKGQTFDLLELI